MHYYAVSGHLKCSRYEERSQVLTRESPDSLDEIVGNKYP